MATTTVNPPISHAQAYGTLGHAYVFAQQEILMALEDGLDVLGLGIIPLMGDLAGSGSDTLRVTDLGEVGWNLPMTALTGETEAVTPSTVQLGYEELTIGMYGLAQSETYMRQVLGRPADGVSLDRLKGMVPMSWLATLRQLVCTTGAGMATAVGSATAPLSVDDHLDLATVYRTTMGSQAPWAMIDGVQLDQLMRSYRNEPAFGNSAGEFAALLGIKMDGGSIAQRHPNLAGMGIDFAVTDDIVQSGGARQGFSTTRGGIGYGIANTSPIKPANTNGAIYIPNFGLFIEELSDRGRQTQREYRATAFLGAMLGSTRVFPQRRLISII
jgi:hypothetical protein